MLLVLFDTKLFVIIILVYKHMLFILFSIPFPNLISFVIEYLSRCPTVLYQFLAMTTEISNIGARIN